MPAEANKSAKRMKRRYTHAMVLVLAVLAIACPSAAHAQALVSKVQVLERGIYRSVTTKRTDQPGTTGIANTVRDVHLLASTTTVFGSAGTRFGLRYVATGGPGAEAELTYVIKFPADGLRNPATGRMILQSTQSAVVPLGVPLYWEYHLENDWEVVPGLWTFEFWYGGQKLGEQRFCVHEFARAGPPRNPAHE
jgi:hypothetical protein